ncbi:DUF222 domain-containing protein [uncultured Amnibacterium sp.]|uniref:HNH endonuclease signature motif containing protein n=1 Tax=uncultured Amnibacterium sp. TaxID=1631851 RepID=UPI0035CA83DF
MAVSTREALAVVLAAPRVRRTFADDELLAEAEAWEAIGRVADARRLAVAAEIDQRSLPGTGLDGLAQRAGDRTGVEHLARRLRIDPREATRRVKLGKVLAPGLTLTGEELPARFPALAEAVQRGEIGIDSAREATEVLTRTSRRAKATDIGRADRVLAERAAVLPPEELRKTVQRVEAWIDPDGPVPTEVEQRRARAFRQGRLREDGTTRWTLDTIGEDTALIRSALTAHRRQSTWQHGTTEAADDGVTGTPDEPCWHEAAEEPRTKPQFDHDIVIGILRAGIRAEQDGSGDSGSTPHEVVVHATVSDLTRHAGSGWAEEVLGRFSIPTIERLTCSGTTRLLVTDDHGEALTLGRRTRLFTPAQKRAIAARDGGCAWPGCTAPVSWTDAHHVEWWHRDTGPTDITNGVLLCSFHHHLAHTTTRWKIRMHQGFPHLVPSHWTGPPEPRQQMGRRRTAPSTDPPVPDTPGR